MLHTVNRRDPSEHAFYVSGHLDLTVEEFAVHYAPRILQALGAGHRRFVVGDAPGCDLMAQQMLVDLKQGRCSALPSVAYPDIDLRVYHMFSSPRRLYDPLHTAALVGGFLTDEERDAAMTRASDEDIAWVRPGKRKRNSGTAKNLQRRLDLQRARVLEGRRAWPRFVVAESYDDDGVHLHLHDPTDPLTAHPELAIPVEPGVLERYRAAQERMRLARREYYEVQRELREMQLAAEMYRDDEEEEGGSPPPADCRSSKDSGGEGTVCARFRRPPSS